MRYHVTCINEKARIYRAYHSLSHVVLVGVTRRFSLFSPLLYRLSYLPISKNPTTYATASVSFPVMGAPCGKVAVGFL